MQRQGMPGRTTVEEAPVDAGCRMLPAPTGQHNLLDHNRCPGEAEAVVAVRTVSFHIRCPVRGAARVHRSRQDLLVGFHILHYPHCCKTVVDYNYLDHVVHSLKSSVVHSRAEVVARDCLIARGSCIQIDSLEAFGRNPMIHESHGQAAIGN